MDNEQQRRKPGPRPTGKTTMQMMISITLEQRAALERVALAKKTHMSGIIRDALDEWFAKHGVGDG